MRPVSPVRKTRRARVVAGALMIGIPASAVALTAGQALAASASAQSGSVVPAHVRDQRISFGQSVVVTGTVPSSEAGHPLQLQFAPAGARSWQALAATTAGAGGRYRLSAPLRSSGMVRVLDVAGAGPSGSPVIGTAAAASASQHVAVAAKLRLRPRRLSAYGAQRQTIRGRMAPALPGRIVSLQGRSRGGWHTLAATKTGRGGRFTLRFTPQAGHEQLRVRFAGDRQNAQTAAAAGSIAVFQATLASWYYDGGQTACGFHAYYGVANKYLPCGTRVSFSSGGRTVTAVVDDRGPYVGGREWDLNQNTAAALGFGGVGVVWSSF